MKKILILGDNGMLGNLLVRLFDDEYQITTTKHRYPSNEFKELIMNYSGDFIVNCIGAIPQKTKDFSINTTLPVFLEKNSNVNIIHPSTDCEGDNTEYGLSKEIATEWLLKYGKKTKIIKSSIIGIENETNYSLLSWVISQKNNIDGYVDAKWNGITTLEWGKQCKKLIENWDNSNLYNILITDCISKYELLTEIKSVFKLDFEITPINNIGKNKCLTGVKLNNIKNQLIDLKIFYKL